MAQEWYVLRVQAGKEDQVKEALEKKLRVAGLDHLVGEVSVPKKKETSLRADGKTVTKDVKIFPGYIYLQADLYDGQDLRDNLYYLIKETPSVGDFAGSFGRPAPMSPEDVEKIHNRTPAAAATGTTATPTAEEAITAGEERGDISIPYKKGDRVVIREGHPFGGFEGSIEEIDIARGQVKVIITILGRPTEVEISYDQIEAAVS